MGTLCIRRGEVHGIQAGVGMVVNTSLGIMPGPSLELGTAAVGMVGVCPGMPPLQLNGFPKLLHHVSHVWPVHALGLHAQDGDLRHFPHAVHVGMAALHDRVQDAVDVTRLQSPAHLVADVPLVAVHQGVVDWLTAAEKLQQHHSEAEDVTLLCQVVG